MSGHVVHRESTVSFVIMCTLSAYRERKGNIVLDSVNSVIFTIQHIRKSSFKLSEHWASGGVKAMGCLAVKK
jgi:hypothetical protein